MALHEKEEENKMIIWQKHPIYQPQKRFTKIPVYCPFSFLICERNSALASLSNQDEH